MTKFSKQTHLWAVKPVYCINMIFACLGSVRIVKNCDLGHKFCVLDTKNVYDFVSKHFASATNVSQFAQPKKHHGQQCVRNNVSSVVYQGLNISQGLGTTKCRNRGPLDTEIIPCPLENQQDHFTRFYLWSFEYHCNNKTSNRVFLILIVWISPLEGLVRGYKGWWEAADRS